MERKLLSALATVRTPAMVLTVLAILGIGLATESCARKKEKHVIAPIPDVRTIKTDTHFCETNAAICERRCAGCSDKVRCFASGGECRADVAGAETHIRDEMDRGPDIWLPGCHVYYDNIGCTGPKKTMWGDTCRSPTDIDEWFERTCHIDLGDHYLDDCNAKCKQLGLGAGKCVTDVGFCSGGINSAHCECEEGA